MDDAQVAVAGAALGLAIDILQEDVQLHPLVLDGETGVGLGQEEEVGDQAAHVLGFGFDLVQHVGPFGGRERGPALEEGGVAEDGGEGGAEFVADVAGKAPLALEQLLQPRQHLVEGADEGADLILAGAADGNAAVKPAGACDLEGGGSGLLDGAQGHTRQPVAHTRSQGQGRGANPEQVDGQTPEDGLLGGQGAADLDDADDVAAKMDGPEVDAQVVGPLEGERVETVAALQGLVELRVGQRDEAVGQVGRAVGHPAVEVSHQHIGLWGKGGIDGWPQQAGDGGAGRAHFQQAGDLVAFTLDVVVHIGQDAGAHQGQGEDGDQGQEQGQEGAIPQGEAKPQRHGAFVPQFGAAAVMARWGR